MIGSVGTVEVWNFSDREVIQKYDGKDYRLPQGLVEESVIDYIAADFERLAGKHGVVAVRVPPRATKAQREDVIRERRLYALEKMRRYAEELLHDAMCVVHDHRGKPVHRRDNKVAEREERLTAIETMIEKAPKPKAKPVDESQVDGAIEPPDSPRLSDLGRNGPHPGAQELGQLAG